MRKPRKKGPLLRLKRLIETHLSHDPHGIHFFGSDPDGAESHQTTCANPWDANTLASLLLKLSALNLEGALPKHSRAYLTEITYLFRSIFK